MSGNSRPDTTIAELEPGEAAVIISEDGGSVSVRVVAGRDADGEQAPEIVIALATRLLKDPDFHDEVLDWYYAHQEEDDEEAEED